MKTSTVHTVYVIAESASRAEALTHWLATDPRFSVRIFTKAKVCQGALRATVPLIVIVATDFAAAVPLVTAVRSLHAPPPVMVVAPPCAGGTAAAAPLIEAGANVLFPADSQAAGQIMRLTYRLLAELTVCPTDRLANLSGNSPSMQAVFQLVRKAAASRITVSVRGETGTGKEEVARAIHAASPRAHLPFVGLNMAAIPHELLESELFGHEKGAFTGAQSTRIGHFELAGTGTLFLDEIADLDLALQAKLLRVVQERAFTRVGGSRTLPLTARLIVATHADLGQCVYAGTFREDLYYRLLGLPIMLPPLRERGSDVIMLANRFLREFCPPGEGGPCGFSRAAEERLMLHPYPGNVRELRAVVELAAVLTETDHIEADDLMFPPDHHHHHLTTSEPVLTVANTRLTLRQHMASIVQHYLDHYHGNVVAAAGYLGVGKSTLYRMIQSGEVRINP